MAGQRERRSTVAIGDAVELNETATVAQGRLWVDVISGPVGGGNTQYAEDTAHVSGDQVTLAGVVQQAADAAISGDGDRSILQVDETGYLKVNVKTGGTGGTQYAEDSLHVSGDTLTLAGVVQQTADAALTWHGDRSLLQVDATGWAKVNVKAPFPVASALSDTDANPTTSRVGANLLGWNGSQWYRAGGSAANGLEVDVRRIAAGTNNIGDVDIASLQNSGHQTKANSISVAIASDQSAIPVSGTVSVTEPVSVDDNGGSLTVDDGGLSLTVDGTVAATQSGTWNINNVSGTVSLPTGAATAANQVTEIASLSVIDDWDETDRAKVNPIVGQAGVQGASGTVSASTQRVVLATDVALPAGTNNIGDVDVLTLPAIPAGNNNIGDVDVASIAAGNNNIGDVDVASLPNEGQQTMANSISVAIASDQAAYYFSTVLTNVNTVYDASPTSATSGAFTVTPYRKFMLSYEVVKSAGTPTDIQFFVDYNNGATWVQYRNDFWGQLLYDDVATSSKLSRCHSGDCVGTQMRVRCVATGTGAAASFTVTNAKMECKN